MTTDDKEFIITHVFRDVSGMMDNEWQYSPIGEHVGVSWSTAVLRKEGYLGVCLLCQEVKKDKEWSIEVWREGMIRSKNGKTHSKASEVIYKSTDKHSNWGWGEFIKWEDLLNDYVINDTLIVEFRVKIRRMTGIILKEKKKNLQNFDESTKQFSDVVLVVENQKFYVSKLFLASQSPYFEAIFLGNFKESNQSEIPLNDVNAKDFQNFLELLYGESPIDGIAHLADMYNVNFAIRKCEKFLMKHSEKSLREKLQLAHRHNLMNLRDHCLRLITSAADIRAVLSNDLSEMDIFVVSALMQKSLALNEQ